jgi:OOP family OmpA-OmpF porin
MLTKKTMLGVGALVLSGVAVTSLYAADPGAYVGGQLGWGNTQQSFLTGSDFKSSFKQKDDGIAGRVFAGYQFDPTWGVELGWTKFSTADVKGKNTYVFWRAPSDIRNVAGTRAVTDNGTIRTDALDLVGKATVPVNDKVSVYGKFGAAYVMDRFHSTTGYAHADKTNQKENKLFPTAGVGASYALTSNLSTDIEYDRIQKVGNSSKIGSADLASVGFTYHFG